MVVAVPTPNLTENQIDFLRGVVRLSYRRQLKGRATLQKKYGDNFNPAISDQRLAFIVEVYRALGGNPNRIAT